MSLLDVIDVTKRFGGLFANKNVSFCLEKGEILGLVGPNGAGKSTIFNCISGYHSTTSGKILFQGKDITNKPPYALCKKGIARTFQVVENFQKMSVVENVMVGAFVRQKSRKRASNKSLKILQFIGLLSKKNILASDLSPPEQRRLGLAMALASEPLLLALDEVMAGLMPKEIDEFLELLRKIRKSGVSLIIIEHLMRAVMTICERIVVLDQGKKIAEGNPSEICKNEVVIKAYLGGGTYA